MAKDDRILLSTRIVAALIVPFLIFAFIVLYLRPETSGERFAWEIRPNMTAALMGAGYLGGSWLFINAVFGRHWHRVSTGFLPVGAFTAAMLLATFLHWERFDINHVPFLLWFILYAIAPLLLPTLWWRNRVTDPGTPEMGDALVPKAVMWGLGALSVVVLLFAAWGILAPQSFAAIWPWQLSPLTARIVGGWFVLLGFAGSIIARDRRWSAWRVGLESIGLWHFLVLIAAFSNASDFPNGLANWYVISVVLVLTGMAVLYIGMEIQRRRLSRSQPPAAIPA